MKKKSGENGRRADILGPPPFPAARPGMGKRDGGTGVREMFLGRVPVSPRSRRLSRWASGEEGGGRAGGRARDARGNSRDVRDREDRPAAISRVLARLFLARRDLDEPAAAAAELRLP